MDDHVAAGEYSALCTRRPDRQLDLLVPGPRVQRGGLHSLAADDQWPDDRGHCDTRGADQPARRHCHADDNPDQLGRSRKQHGVRDLGRVLPGRWYRLAICPAARRLDNLELAGWTTIVRQGQITFGGVAVAMLGSGEFVTDAGNNL